MILLSVSVVLTMYLLAVGRRWVAIVLVGGAVALTLAVLAVHGAPKATAWVDVVVQAVVLLVILCGFVIVHRVSTIGAGRRGNLTRWVTTWGRYRPRPGRAHEDAGLSESEVLASIAAQAGIRRIHFVAWRDLDDPEAGGSELHAHRIASRWAAAGLDVTFRTSAVPGAPAALTRDGYRVLRQSGRYAVFPGAAWEGIRMGHRPGDALVEIWNGMPFLSPTLVPGAAGRLPAPRARRDVGHGAAAGAGPDGQPGRAAASRRASTARAASSPCRTRRATRSWTCWGCAPTTSRWPRPGWTTATRRAASGRPRHWSWPWGGWCR